MKEESLRGTERSVISKEAKAILGRSGNRLLLIEALAVLLLFFAMYELLHTSFSELLYFLNLDAWGTALAQFVFYALLFSLTQFFTLPTVLGIFYMARQMYDGEETTLADLFFFFSSRRRYGKALRLSVRFCILLFLLVILSESMYLGFSFLLPPTLPYALLCGFLIAVLTIGWVLLVFVRFPRLFLALSDESVSADPAEERYGERGEGLFCGMRFLLRFLPALLLGILTFGVLLLIDTFPKMLVTYMCESAALGEREL